MSRDEPGPFSLTPASVPFAIVPGLVLMFSLAPAAAPAVPLPLSGLLFGFLGSVLGLVTYRAVREYGPLVRIGALTALCALLAAASMALVQGAG